MKITQFTAAFLLTLAFTFGFAPDSPAKGKGKSDRIREQVKWDVVPAPVQATIQENAADGKIRTIEKETRRGAVTYEAEVKRRDGKIMGIEVAENGKLISVEVEADEDSDESD